MKLDLDNLVETVVTSVVFAGVGLAVFTAAFWLMQKLSPFSFRKEIEEDHNIALAIITAGVMIGIALIVASSIHG